MLTNKLGLPQPFVDAATSDHAYSTNRYSVTELLGGTCEAILKRRHQGEGEEDVSDRVWAILGTAVHKVLQEAEAKDTQLQENWVSVPIDGTPYELSGVFDLYDDANGTVTDYKTCSVWKLQVGNFEDWRKQTLLYCWILRRLGFNAHRGEIVAIMRDHNMRKAKTEAGYPEHPVMRMGWEFSPEDLSEAEDCIRDWFDALSHQLSRHGDPELTPCDPEQRWHKADTYAVVKDGNKRATRVLEDPDAAAVLCDELTERTGKPHHVEFRQGEDTRCQSYCSVVEFCPYGKKVSTS